MRIPSGSTDRLVYFVAVDSTDLKTRETGLSSFTVYRSRNGGAATAYTTPTVSELSAANMPGVYALTIDEDTTIGGTHDTEEYCVHITQASMAPVTRVIELYRPKITEGQTVTAANGAADADIERLQGNVIATPTVAGVLEVDVTHFNGTAGTFAAGRPEVNTTHWAGTAVASAVILNAANIGADAITDAKVAADVTIASVTGAVGSVTGAVGSVTGNVGGNVVGSVGSVTAAVTVGTINANVITATAIANGAIDAATFAAGAIDAAALAADAGTEIATAVWASGTRTLTASLDPTAATIADAVWDELVSGHTTGGTFGGDVAMIGDLSALSNLDVAVSTRLATAGYTAPDNASIAAILDDTGTSGVLLTVAERAAVADKVLGRSIAGGADGGRTVTSALRTIRNRRAIAAGVLTVYAEDDATPDYTAAVSTAAGNPITEVDPV